MPSTNPNKTSFLLDDGSKEILEARNPAPGAHKAHGQRSDIIREVLYRYDEICREELPQLSEDEWDIILEAGKGWGAPKASASSTVLIASLIESSRRHPGNDKLLRKLLALTSAERIAVVDAVECYSAAVSRGEKPVHPAKAHEPPRAKRSAQ